MLGTLLNTTGFRPVCVAAFFVFYSGCFHDSMGESLGPVTQATTESTETGETTDTTTDPSTTAGPTDPTTSDTETTESPTTDPTDATTISCTPGEENCMCNGSVCDDGLVCDDDLCIPEGEGFCGDGEVDPGESCDDGNDEDDDVCHNDCRLPGELLWDNVHNGPANGIDAGFAVASTSEGMVFAGGYETVDGFAREALIRQYTPEGTEGWSTSFGTLLPDANDVVTGLAISQDTTLVAVGAQQGLNGTDTFLKGYSLEGSEVWDSLRAAGNSRTYFPEDVVVAEDGTIFVAGSSTFDNNDNDAWVAAFDPTGELIWEHFEFLGGGFEEEARGVALIDPAGEQGLIACGFQTDPDNLDLEVWLARYPAQGTEPMWQYQYSDADNVDDSAVDCEVVGNNALVLARRGDATDLRTLELTDGDPVINPKLVEGVTPGGIAVSLENSLVVSGTTADSDIWVRRFDSGGSEVWTTTHDGPAGDEDFGQRVTVDATGHIAVVGGVTNLTEGFNLWVGRFAP